MTELPLIGDYSTPTTPLSGARIGVITFPGTLDDVDALRAVRLAGAEPVSLWHADADPQRTLAGVDAVVIPGGFSYGDYLRAGAIARFAPMMDAVATAAGGPEGDADGLPVLGICNGFQILTESHLRRPGGRGPGPHRHAGHRRRCRGGLGAAARHHRPRHAGHLGQAPQRPARHGQ